MHTLTGTYRIAKKVITTVCSIQLQRADKDARVSADASRTEPRRRVCTSEYGILSFVFRCSDTD
jgi:hypothetical protein